MVSELGFSDMLSLAQTIGIVGTMLLTSYFSKRQIQSLSIDQQTRVLNDFNEKYYSMAELAMEDPSIQKVIDNEGKTLTRIGIFFLHPLDMFSCICYASVLNDIEWTGWLQRMRNCFRKGTIGETWKQVEPDGWSFQNFVNTKLIAERYTK